MKNKLDKRSLEKTSVNTDFVREIKAIISNAQNNVVRSINADFLLDNWNYADNFI